MNIWTMAGALFVAALTLSLGLYEAGLSVLAASLCAGSAYTFALVIVMAIASLKPTEVEAESQTETARAYQDFPT